MRRFFVQPENIRDGRVRLTGHEAYHARRVLRLKPEDDVLLLDGRGNEFSARIVSETPAGLDLMILEEHPAPTESPLDLTLGLALIKPDRMEWAIQKGTELGLKTFIPVRTARCTARLEPTRSDHRLERWARISREAVKQSRRGMPVDIHPPMDLDKFLAHAGEAELRIMLYEGVRSGLRPHWKTLLARSPRPRRVAALVGPEGGFTDTEVDAARAAGFELLGLGPRILRSETAAMAMMTVLVYELGDLV